MSSLEPVSAGHVDPPPIHESPAWEVHQPKTSKRLSYLSKAGLASKETSTTGVASVKEASADSQSEELNKDVVSTAPVAGVSAFSPRPTLKERFDRVVPAHRRYFGRSRRTALIIVAVILLCLLALVLGLAIGLSRKSSSSSQNLPLPSNKGIFTGDLTYYDNSLGLGACGLLSASSDMICAVSHLVYDAASISGNPNENPLCGQMIRITRYQSSTGTNSSVDVKVIDRCVGCAAVDIDLSLGAFTKLADQSLGRVTGSWAWLT